MLTLVCVFRTYLAVALLRLAWRATPVLVALIVIAVTTVVAMIFTVSTIVMVSTAVFATIEAIVFDTVLTIVRHIHVAIPTLPHEVDRPTARMIAAAMSSPVFPFGTRHIEIQRLHHNSWRRRLDNDCSRGHEHWARCVTDFDVAEEPRFANGDRHADIRHGRCRNQPEADCKEHGSETHIHHPL